MSKKVSIIVPVYNVEQYLEQCIKSLVNQTYHNIEIILVVDGATDNSLAICQKYAVEDQRIRLIFQNNSGVDVARNNGLSHSTGDLIALIDSDDWVEPHYIENLANQMERYDSDIAVTAYKSFHQDDQGYYVVMDPSPNNHDYDGCYSNIEWMKKFFLIDNFTSEVVWSRLIKRELFDKIRFPLYLKTCDDAYVAWRLSMAADKISYENKIDYTYRRFTANSLSTNKHAKKMPYDQVRVLEERIATMTAAGLDCSYLFPRYKNRLEAMRDNALEIGDYSAYQSSGNKLENINQNHGLMDKRE